MQILLDGTPTWKLRMLLWGGYAACAGMLWWGWDLSRTYGLNPGDGGVLRPLWERLAFGGFTAFLGLGFAASMILMTRIYVTRLMRDGKRLVIETLTALGVGARRIEVPVGAVKGGSYHHGSGPNGVDAPWITLRVQGRRIPFMLDVKARGIDRSGLSRLLPRAVSAWTAARG
ncbi:MAG: hypothetical protein AB7U38_08725 [Hyphomicrobiales bacterium]